MTDQVLSIQTTRLLLGARRHTQTKRHRNLCALTESPTTARKCIPQRRVQHLAPITRPVLVCRAAFRGCLVGYAVG